MTSYVTEEETSKEYAALINGASSLYADKGFLNQFTGARHDVVDWVCDKIAETPPSESRSINVVFGALLPSLSQSVRSGPPRRKILTAIGSLNLSSEESSRICQLILQEKDNTNIASVIAALGSRFGDGSQQTLFAAIKESKEPRVRVSAASVLGSGLSDPALRTEVMASFWEWDHGIREALLTGVLSCPESAGGGRVFAMKVIQADQSDFVRARAVSYLAVQTDAPPPDAVTLVRSFVRSSHPSLRESAVEFLARKGALTDIPILESVAKSDDDEVIRLKAVKAVEAVKSRK